MSNVELMLLRGGKLSASFGFGRLHGIVNYSELFVFPLLLIMYPIIGVTSHISPDRITAWNFCHMEQVSGPHLIVCSDAIGETLQPILIRRFRRHFGFKFATTHEGFTHTPH